MSKDYFRLAKRAAKARIEDPSAAHSAAIRAMAKAKPNWTPTQHADMAWQAVLAAQATVLPKFPAPVKMVLNVDVDRWMSDILSNCADALIAGGELPEEIRDLFAVTISTRPNGSKFALINWA